MLNLVSFVFVFYAASRLYMCCEAGQWCNRLVPPQDSTTSTMCLTPQTLEHTDECKHFTKMGHENMSAVVRIYE